MQKPIVIAQVMGKMVGGGLESVVMNYFRAIDRRQFTFEFIIDEDSTHVPMEEIFDLGGDIFVAPPYQNIVAYLGELRRHFEETRPALVHAHMNALSGFPLYAAKRAGVRHRIAHAHSTAGKGEPLRNALKAVLKPLPGLMATQRLACSHHAGTWLFGHRSFDVVPNAIDIEAFRFDARVRRRLREDFGIASDQIVLGHGGRFVPQKNHRFLLDVMEQVVRQEPRAVLLLAGDGPLQDSLRGAARQKGLANHVRLLGQVDAMANLYNAFDVLLLPSLYEGLGLVAVEAQANGLACLLSDRCPREADIAGRCEFLSLTQPPEVWARHALALGREGNRRRNEADKANVADMADEAGVADEPRVMRDNGSLILPKTYDINRAAIGLQRYYERLLKPEEYSNGSETSGRACATSGRAGDSGLNV